MAKLGSYNKEFATTYGLIEAVVLHEFTQHKEKFKISVGEYSKNMGISRRALMDCIENLLENKFIDLDFENDYISVNKENLYPYYDFEEKISAKDKKILESEEYKYISSIILKQDSIFRKHRLSNKPTKLIKTIYEYFIALENGTFLDKIKLDDKYIAENKNKLETFKEVRFFDEVKELFDKAMEGLKTRQGKQYYPLNKDYITNMGMDTFFYNPVTAFSWFVECVLNEPNEIISEVAEKKLESVPVTFCGPLKEHFNYENLPSSDKKNVAQGILKIYLNWKDLADKYSGIYRNTNWISYYETAEGFVGQIIYYLNHYALNIPSGYFASDDFWFKFTKYAKDFHGVVLNPSFEFLMDLKKNADEEVSRKSESEILEKKIEEARTRRQMKFDFENL